jgi:hypothetical protein
VKLCASVALCEISHFCSTLSLSFSTITIHHTPHHT